MSGYANPRVLVDCDFVKEHGGDPGVRLVEVDVDTELYDKEGHIEGAIAWNWTSQLQDAIRRDIPSKEQFEELMRAGGIKNEDTVILYGDNNNWFAAYAYWIMKMYGHEDVRLLNGGRKKWVADGRSLTHEVPSYPRSSYTAREANPRLRATQAFVLESIGKRPMVDVRSPQEFSGEIMAPPGLSETAQRAGHIPGAANIPWSQAVDDDGTFKSYEELRKIYGAKGVTDDKEVITYCRIGERSSHTWFALKELLGYPDVRNYDGSWTEWGSMVGVPIENPSAKRAS